MSIEKPSKKRSALAILFAGGLLQSQQPAISAPKPTSRSSESIVQLLESNSKATPEIRAQLLIRLAGAYLKGESKAQLDTQFKRNLSGGGLYHFRSRWWKGNLITEAENATTEFGSAATTRKTGKAASSNEKALANLAATKALAQLDSATDEFVKLNVYYIASVIFKNLGNEAQLKKCNAFLNESFKKCEVAEPPNEKLMEGAVAVLDAMAFRYVPARLPYQHATASNNLGMPSAPVSAAAFKQSEQLKLRAAAMVDRLPVESNLRRQVHRDLAVWYEALGKKNLATREKQTLYRLVGFKDESILTPQVGGCGILVWWQKDPIAHTFDCGMG